MDREREFLSLLFKAFTAAFAWSSSYSREVTRDCQRLMAFAGQGAAPGASGRACSSCAGAALLIPRRNHAGKPACQTVRRAGNRTTKLWQSGTARGPVPESGIQTTT